MAKFEKTLFIDGVKILQLSDLGLRSDDGNIASITLTGLVHSHKEITDEARAVVRLFHSHEICECVHSVGDKKTVVRGRVVKYEEHHDSEDKFPFGVMSAQIVGLLVGDAN